MTSYDVKITEKAAFEYSIQKSICNFILKSKLHFFHWLPDSRNFVGSDSELVNNFSKIRHIIYL